MTVVGYATAVSVTPGDQLGFCLSTDRPGSIPVTLSISRVGGGAAGALSATVSTQPILPNAWAGYGWLRTAQYTIPSDWPTGLYSASADDGTGSAEVLRFVVLPTAPGTASPILLQICFIEPQAYSTAGGKSLYGSPGADFDYLTRAALVSFDRHAGLPGREDPLISWLQAEGREVEYCSDVDFDVTPGLLDSYDCLIIAGHDEYWTQPKRDQVERFVDGGGNLIVLSGNTCFRQVRLDNNFRQIVCYKDAGYDPEPDTSLVTTAWADPPVNNPPNRLIGVGYTYGCQADGAGTPYTIRFSNHWVFAGVPLDQTTTSDFLGYETDAAGFVDEDEGYPRVTGEEGTPLSFVVLASADMRSSQSSKPGFATMGIYHRNGIVFNAAAVFWVRNLDDDPVVAQVTRNVINRLMQRVPPDWEDVGHANLGTALTAVTDRLFITTSENRLWRRYPVEAEVVWRDINEAIDVIAMAGIGDSLYCVTGDNTLWLRPAVEDEVAWTPIGTGPPGSTLALGASGGILYAVDPSGALLFTAASAQPPPWSPLPNFSGDSTINAMTAHEDILFACTTDGRLLRTDRDSVFGSSGWYQVHELSFSCIGLAAIQGMLFAATTENRLLRLDLHGLRVPAPGEAPALPSLPPPPPVRTPKIEVQPFPVPVDTPETISVQAVDPIDGSVVTGTTTISQPNVSGNYRVVSAFPVPGSSPRPVTLGVVERVSGGPGNGGVVVFLPRGYFTPSAAGRGRYTSVEYDLVDVDTP